jgi:hypothetical protein
MNIFSQMANKIVKEQELVIGPLAWIEASKVPGIRIDKVNRIVELGDDNGTQVINGLVNQYKRLFGLASQEVCKEAVKNLLTGLSQTEIPLSLQ